MSSVDLAPDSRPPPVAQALMALRDVPDARPYPRIPKAAQTLDVAPADEALMMAVARGEHPALLALYDSYGGIAFGLAYRILKEAGAAEEAVQDAYLRVWRRAATFDPARGSVRPWLLTIVHHCAIDLLRRRGGDAPGALSFDEMIDRRAASDLWSDDADCDERERVRAAVASLPETQRRAIEQAYFEGFTHREIAQRDGLPLGTVKGRLRLGLHRLSALLTHKE